MRPVHQSPPVCDAPKKLSRAAYQSFAQRVGMAYHLGPLDEAGTAAYVRHRLSVAGRSRALLDDAALDAIFEGSGGIPRRINTICQGALLVAFGEGADAIGREVIVDVLDDLNTHLGAVFPPIKPAPAFSPGGAG